MPEMWGGPSKENGGGAVSRRRASTGRGKTTGAHYRSQDINPHLRTGSDAGPCQLSLNSEGLSFSQTPTRTQLGGLVIDYPSGPSRLSGFFSHPGSGFQEGQVPWRQRIQPRVGTPGHLVRIWSLNPLFCFVFSPHVPLPRAPSQSPQTRPSCASAGSTRRAGSARGVRSSICCVTRCRKVSGRAASRPGGWRLVG